MKLVNNKNIPDITCYITSLPQIYTVDVKKFPLRMQELDSALLGNLRNPHITKIHIVAALDEHHGDGKEANKEFWPVSFDFLRKRGFQLPKEARKSNRLVFVASSGRPTMRSMIRYSNEKICPGSITVKKGGGMLQESDVFLFRTAPMRLPQPQ